EAGGASRAAALAARYAEAFPQTYRADYGPAEAAQDIERLRRLASGERDCPLGRDARLYRLDGDPLDQVRLKIYQLGGAMPLSDAVPALENFGFRVLAENPTRLGGTDPGPIHDVRPARAQAGPDAVLARAAASERAVGAVIHARAEDDVFNRLIVGTGLSAQEAAWMRALYRYLSQTSIAFTIYTVVDALAGAPAVTRGLIELFRRRRDAEFSGGPSGAAAGAEESYRARLARVDASNHDPLQRLYSASRRAGQLHHHVP